MTKLIEEQPGLPPHEEIIALLQKPLADREGTLEMGRRVALALAKIIEQNEMILIALQWRHLSSASPSLSTQP